MGSKAFHFAITPCCLIFQCELFRVGIFAMKFTPFCVKVKNPEMRRTDISVKKWRLVNNRPRSRLYPPPQNIQTRHVAVRQAVRATFNNGPAVTAVKTAVETRGVPSEFAADITGWERTDIQQSRLFVSWLNWSDIAHDCCGWYTEHSCTGNNERLGFYCFVIHSVTF